jgi:hypothetical protein
MLQTTTALNHYGLICLGEINYLDSPLGSDEFIDHAVKLKDVLNITRRRHFEIWQHMESMWYPIYGCVDPVPLIELTRPSEEVRKRAQQQEFIELGSKATKLYVTWNRRVKQYDRHISRRSEEGLCSNELKRGKQRLQHDVQCMDEIVASVKKGILQELFDLKYRKEYQLSKISKLLHVSTSTVNRYTMELKRIVGTDLHKTLSNDEIEEKFHVQWRYEN